MIPAVRARGLRYRYSDGTEALRGVDFELFAGETVAVLGPNGSGKTTFVLCLHQLLKCEGECAADGRVGLVFQNPDDQLFMPTVLDDVGFGPRNLGCSVDQTNARAQAALDQVGLLALAHKAPHQLSAGEKQRAAIAGVLAMQPDVLIFDEPTTFLDPRGRRELVALLRGLPQAKLLVTHDVGFARALASRAVFFEQGRIVADGGLDEIVKRFDWDSPPSA
jgi:cobalt/nickel transport system ATP-binding protein